jgi:hypothetical protein
MTRISALSSVIHVSIFGVPYVGGTVLVTDATEESCAAVTPAKTMNVTIVALMRYSRMMMAMEMETI